MSLITASPRWVLARRLGWNEQGHSSQARRRFCGWSLEVRVGPRRSAAAERPDAVVRGYNRTEKRTAAFLSAAMGKWLSAQVRGEFAKHGSDDAFVLAFEIHSTTFDCMRFGFNMDNIMRESFMAI